MIDPFLEIAKHLGMQGLVLFGCGYYIMYLTRTNKDEREAQRQAHSNEREEWKAENKSMHEQLILVLNKTNDIDSKLTQELSLIKEKLSDKK